MSNENFNSLLIKNDGISWGAKQPVDPYVINMLHKVLWPAPLASAVWQYTKTVVGQSYSKLVGISSEQMTPSRPGGVIIIAGADEKRSQVTLPVKKQIPDSTAAGTPPAEQGKEVPSQPVNQNNTSRSTSTRKETDFMSESRKALGPVHSKIFDLARAPADLMRELSPSAWDQLVSSVRSIWARGRRQPPRGCVKMYGLMHVETTKAFVMLDVVAFWDTKVEKFDRPSMYIGLREVTHKGSPRN